MPAIVGGDVHVGQAADETDPVALELAQRVGQWVFGGPAGRTEQPSRPEWAQRDQPESAIRGRAEDGVGNHQGAKRRTQAGRASAEQQIMSSGRGDLQRAAGGFLPDPR